MGHSHARGEFSLTLVLTAVLLLTVVPLAAAGGEAPPPIGLRARAAILVDQATGRVLYERNADAPFVPASLAKLMSLHIVYEKLEDRSIRADDVVSITTRAWATNQEPGSSLMYLEPGQIVTVEDLMRGTAIASGNDAATALAEYAAGSVEKFVRLMNDECRWLGYRTTRFADPSGLSRDNQASAREFADFCRRYIEWHPQALAELHSLREFFYPLPRNIPSGSSPFLRSYRVYNANYLVWDDFGVDGLKTGHLDDESFTAALTAQRGGTRLIAVLL
ncbi:MAG: D-alanyl-D-alanine carboxypeptidase, partial [Spirochaetes bacterium]|nr:D-alanyl-D-alanine carboxypeptidase [Spirochaetota bacterium]